MAITVSEIFIYPVKSLGRIPLEQAKVQERGLKWDRRWMVVDEAGQFVTQRQVPKMATIFIDVNDDSLVLSAAGVEKISIFHVAANRSARLPVTVWKDTVPAQVVTELADEWLSDYLGLKCRLVYMPDDAHRRIDPRYSANDRNTSFADGFPILITNRASLTDLCNRASDAIPMTRFRPNIVIEGALPFAEDGWGTFRIGSAMFEAVKPCSRCIITTIDQDSGEKMGKEPLRTLAKFRRQDDKVMFGENLVVLQSGTIGVGDTLEMMVPRSPYPLPIPNQISVQP